MKVKVPKFKLPKPPTLVTTRSGTGQKELLGLTPKEWVVTTGVLCALYVVMAAYFTALLFIAQAIQNNKDNVSGSSCMSCWVLSGGAEGDMDC